MEEFPHEFSADCFSESYEEARAKFLEAAAQHEIHELLVFEDEAGRYTTDVAVLRGSGDPESAGFVFVTSGTHGVEGYAGSAIQILLLRWLTKAPVSPTVVLIHAVNPWGMANFRRVNENNVDLNRNALQQSHFDKLTTKDSLGDAYMTFNELFNPTNLPGPFHVHVGSWLQMAASVARHGLAAMKTALVAATYRQSKGVFYGGCELQASHAALRDFIVHRFGEVKAEDVTWIDVHTGLGPCGVDVLLGGGRNEAEMQALFAPIPGHFGGFQSGIDEAPTDEMVAARCAPSAGTSGGAGASNEITQAAGYQFTVGGLIQQQWLNRLFKPNSGRALAFAQEFGTVSFVSLVRALILENAGYHHDRLNHVRWRALTRDAFYVRTHDWKRRILTRGFDVFQKTASRFEKRANEAIRSRL